MMDLAEKIKLAERICKGQPPMATPMQLVMYAIDIMQSENTFAEALKPMSPEAGAAFAAALGDTSAAASDLEQRVLELSQECRDAARKLTEEGWDFKGGMVRDLCKLVEDEVLPALRVAQSAELGVTPECQQTIHHMSRQAELLDEQGHDVSARVMRTAMKVLVAEHQRANLLEKERDQQTRFKYLANERADKAEAALRSPSATTERTEPQWIVNDLGELGVKVGERFFFLYKGGNIEYGEDFANDGGVALHDDSTPMMWRIVGKREFGETCQPLEHFRKRWAGRYQEPLAFTPGLSDGKPEDGDWKPLPAQREPADRNLPRETT